jgi:hypothetical protein
MQSDNCERDCRPARSLRKIVIAKAAGNVASYRMTETPTFPAMHLPIARYRPVNGPDERIYNREHVHVDWIKLHEKDFRRISRSSDSIILAPPILARIVSATLSAEIPFRRGEGKGSLALKGSGHRVRVHSLAVHRSLPGLIPAGA